MDSSIIDRFQKIQNTFGSSSKKESDINVLKRYISSHFADTTDYEDSCLIDGLSQRLIVVHTQNIIEKKIIAFPNETFYSGGIVDCYGQKWLITEVDANKQIYTIGKMTQCSLLLKWQNSLGQIIERWAVIENSGAPQGMNEGNIITTPDLSFKLKLPLDSETINLQRDKRFLADINGIKDEPDAFVITQRDVLSHNYGQGGIIILGITQDSFNRVIDSIELGIADYFVPPVLPSGSTEIIYTNQPIIRVGGSNKRFTAVFKDGDGNILTNITPVWTWTTISVHTDKFIVTSSGSYFDIKVLNYPELIGTSVKIDLTDTNDLYHAELIVEVGDL